MQGWHCAALYFIALVQIYMILFFFLEQNIIIFIQADNALRENTVCTVDQLLKTPSASKPPTPPRYI